MTGGKRVLIIDLNNFASYPTIAVGYLIAALRRDGYDVRLESPLSHGLPAMAREQPETRMSDIQRRIYFSNRQPFLALHDRMHARYRRRMMVLPTEGIASADRAMDQMRPDIVLLSAYLDHRPSVEALAAAAQRRSIPVVLGGPMFNLPTVAEQWRSIPGLTAVVGGEVDESIGGLIRRVIDGEDVFETPGVVAPDGRKGPSPVPLRPLSSVPIPDLTDFPWDRYRQPVLPVMTGRGCSWGRCLFCSDVGTSNGRTFRSKRLDQVLLELQTQSSRHGSKDVIFLDIKLNSDLEVWRGIIEKFQDVLPGGRFVGGVHVGARGDNGLSAADLQAAYAAGMRRISFGLETGSQRVNDLMDKGTEITETSRFLRDATSAGLSVRTTAMLGYPGETADDVAQTAAFLEQHETHIGRVRIARFMAQPGSRFAEHYAADPSRFPGIERFRWDHGAAKASYRYAPARVRAYRAAQSDVLKIVHRINARPLIDDARVFDGLM